MSTLFEYQILQLSISPVPIYRVFMQGGGTVLPQMQASTPLKLLLVTHTQLSHFWKNPHRPGHSVKNAQPLTTLRPHRRRITAARY